MKSVLKNVIVIGSLVTMNSAFAQTASPGTAGANTGTTGTGATSYGTTGSQSRTGSWSETAAGRASRDNSATTNNQMNQGRMGANSQGTGTETQAASGDTTTTY